MKLFVMLLVCLADVVCAFGQDGSDILYIKIKKLDKSYTGRFVQLDFYNRSTILKSTWDTVGITINGKTVRFAEHRQDDGVNNWFYRQYLESVDNDGGYMIRLVKNRIDALTEDSIQVTSYFDFYTKSGALAAGKSIQQQYWFSKKMVNQVLVKEEKRDL